MADLTNEQLVSFVNYQIGQKQGWESLGRVIELVNDADKLVALAKEQAALYATQVEDMKQSLVTLEETRAAKEADLDLHAASKRDAMLQDALKEVDRIVAQRDALRMDILSLDESQIAATANIKKLEAQVLGLQRQKSAAEGDLAAVQKQLADIKASIKG